MKNKETIFIIIGLFSQFIFSQTYNITEYNGDPQQGSYYKDIHNLLNPFEGTYIYQNDAIYIKIVLVKKIMSQGYYNQDLLIGEYQIIQNNEERINSLNLLNSYQDGRNNSIKGNTIIQQGDIGCSSCLPGEKALWLGIGEKPSKYTGDFIVRKIEVNGQEALKVFLRWDWKVIKEGEEDVPAIFPAGEYIFIKQP